MLHCCPASSVQIACKLYFVREDLPTYHIIPFRATTPKWQLPSRIFNPFCTVWNVSVLLLDRCWQQCLRLRRCKYWRISLTHHTASVSSGPLTKAHQMLKHHHLLSRIWRRTGQGRQRPSWYPKAKSSQYNKKRKKQNFTPGAIVGSISWIKDEFITRRIGGVCEE